VDQLDAIREQVIVGQSRLLEEKNARIDRLETGIREALDNPDRTEAELEWALDDTDQGITR
jgi:hypothetical protein